MDFPFAELALFMAAVLFLALFGLTASGHFPAEFRADDLRRGTGAAIMWVTMFLAVFAGGVVILFAWQALPWYAMLIGGGMTLLLAPLLLQPLPDSFVNGRAALATFSGAAGVAALAMWVAA